jgi:hypothetical protein
MIVVTIIVTAIHKPKSPDRKRSGTFSVDLPSSVAVNAFEVKDGWGYEILVNNDLLISQEFIPGFSGQQAFKTQADALKCGELVVQKSSRVKCLLLNGTRLTVYAFNIKRFLSAFFMSLFLSGL